MRVLNKRRVGLAGLVLICVLAPGSYPAAALGDSPLQDGALVRATTDALNAYWRGAHIDASRLLVTQGGQPVALGSVRSELERTMER